MAPGYQKQRTRKNLLKTSYKKIIKEGFAVFKILFILFSIVILGIVYFTVGLNWVDFIKIEILIIYVFGFATILWDILYKFMLNFAWLSKFHYLMSIIIAVIYGLGLSYLFYIFGYDFMFK